MFMYTWMYWGSQTATACDVNSFSNINTNVYNGQISMRFEILTTVLVKINILCDMIPFGLINSH